MQVSPPAPATGSFQEEMQHLWLTYTEYSSWACRVTWRTECFSLLNGIVPGVASKSKNTVKVITREKTPANFKKADGF